MKSFLREQSSPLPQVTASISSLGLDYVLFQGKAKGPPRETLGRRFPSPQSNMQFSSSIQSQKKYLNEYMNNLSFNKWLREGDKGNN